MNIGQKMNRSYSAELYHYSLKHAKKDFKYIKKEMVNGKMRYYYDPDTPKGTLKTAARESIKKEYDAAFVGPVKAGERKPENKTTEKKTTGNIINIVDEKTGKTYKVTATPFKGESYKDRMARLEEKENPKTSLKNMKVTSVKGESYKDRMARLEEEEKRRNKPIIDRLKDWAGVDEGEAYEKARSEYLNAKAAKAMSNLPGHKEVGNSEVLDAKSKLNVARDKYMNTLIGKIDTTIENIVNRMTGSNDDTKVETYAERMARLEEEEKKKKKRN